MKILVSLFLLLSFGACAHKKHCADKTSCQKTEAVKEKVAFDGHCAMGLCNKKLVKGDSQYKLEYKGVVYYFSSAQARDTFVAKVDENIKAANGHWETSAADRAK